MNEEEWEFERGDWVKLVDFHVAHSPHLKQKMGMVGQVIDRGYMPGHKYLVQFPDKLVDPMYGRYWVGPSYLEAAQESEKPV